MDVFKKIKLYKKEPLALQKQKEGMPPLNYLFFCDDKGRDWYEIREAWQGAISVNPEGMVCAAEFDTSLMLMAEGHTLFEVDPSKVPDNVIGNYSYDGKKFIYLESKATASQQKVEMLAHAMEQIRIFDIVAEMRELTSQEATALRAWKSYIAKLYSFKPDTDMQWPVCPKVT